MTTLSVIHSAQDDVAKLQSTLATVQASLDTVETAAVTVDVARRGFRRAVRVGVVLVVVGVAAAAIVLWARSRSDPDDT